MRFLLTYDHYLKIKGQDIQLYVDKGTEVGPGTPYDFEGPPSMFMTGLDDEAKAAIEKQGNRGDPIASLPPTMMPAIGAPAPGPGQKIVSHERK